MSGEIRGAEKNSQDTGRIREFISDFGWPRLIIFFFVILLFVAAPFVKVRVDSSLMNVFVRFGQNGVMVLALVPMMQAGAGLNFGLPVGIVAGLLGSTLAMQFGLAGPASSFGFRNRPKMTSKVLVTTVYR
ncbi:MAG: hypothetical protein LBL20_04190, partial [Treponema sp.]|nr:hypothetical protein [Treponema sp.]